MLFMSTVLEDRIPYEQLGTCGMVVKEDESKFKSNKNDLTFDDVVNLHGADAIRYNYLGTNRVNDIRFGFKMMEEAKRKLMNFYNIASFFDLYYDIDKPDLTKKYNVYSVSDKWLDNRTNKFVKEAAEFYENHEPNNVCKLFDEYVDEVSNLYIKINRKKFWKSEMNDEKYSAYQSLYNALKTMLQVMAQIIPYMTDYVWINLVTKVEPNEAMSVHLSEFPKASSYEQKLLDETDQVRNIVTLVLRIKNENNLKLTQPLRKLYLCGFKHISLDEYDQILRDELNVKDIEYLDNKDSLCTPYLTLDFKVAGMTYKEKVNHVKELLLNLNADEMKEHYNKYSNNEEMVLDDMKLVHDTLRVEYKYNEGIKVAEENDKLVALEITIDDKLYEEFMYRKLLRQCQVARKEANYDVVDRIKLSVIAEDEEVKNMLNNYQTQIATETLSTLSFDKLDNPDYEKEFELLDYKVLLQLKK